MRIGLISDTHGLLRPAALDALRGVDHIIHAGDIGNADILRGLEALAPLTAIRGNNDSAPWAAGIPERITVTLDGLAIHVIHDVNDLRGKPPAVDIVVSGHSHKPHISSQAGIMFINPGSAGPRRFKLPISVALLETGVGSPQAEICLLAV
ncbi:MAG: phosphodiesterase [Paucimonas sp.]|nr:phosphodiesterase [Paucimonas sp.]